MGEGEIEGGEIDHGEIEGGEIEGGGARDDGDREPDIGSGAHGRVEPPPPGVRPGAVEYDCSPWAGETRRILRSLLETRGIPHAWEGTVVVVPLEHEEAVDALVDEVAATARPSLRPGSDVVAWEVSPWSTGSQNRIVEALTTAGLAYEWDDEGNLVTYETDVEEVEALIAGLGELDAAEEPDGLVLMDVLGDLFVAAGRLAGAPGNDGARAAVLAGGSRMEEFSVPFGFDVGQWRTLVDAVSRLAEAVEGPGGEVDPDEHPDHHVPGSDTDVADRAALVRDLLRHYV